MSEGIPLTFYTDDTYSPALKRLMQKVAKRLELSLNEEFWENLYSYTETYCFRAQNRRRMSRAGNDKEDVVISEAEGHAANPGVPEESMDEPTHTALLEDEDKPMCTGLLKDEDIHEDEASYAQSKDEDTHEDKAESSAATVSNMSEDLFDMCLDTLGTTAAICVPPVGTGAAIRDAPVGTTAICDVPIGTTSAIHNAPSLTL
ncbi:hypothetical protein IWW35_000526 [Coemansia sp. RSA 1878]|nr:hypothetical protein IWW35_000526 [Coemansia sp. RSA 1878]